MKTGYCVELFDADGEWADCSEDFATFAEATEYARKHTQVGGRAEVVEKKRIYVISATKKLSTKKL